MWHSCDQPVSTQSDKIVIINILVSMVLTQITYVCLAEKPEYLTSNPEQKSLVNIQCTNLKVRMDQIVSEVNSSRQT